jgi:hypothetical protein
LLPLMQDAVTWLTIYVPKAWRRETPVDMRSIYFCLGQKQRCVRRGFVLVASVESEEHSIHVV